MRLYETACVTGASSGIGAAFARALAGRGTRRMLLTGRDAARLQALAAELRARGVEADLLAGDLSNTDGLEALRARLREDPPELLVNNAGAGVYGAFVSRPLGAQLESIDLNVRALVALSHTYAAARRGRPGALLLVASTAGFFPLPYEAVYGATKSFVIQFGEALAEEWRGTPMVVRTLCPGLTATQFAVRAGLPRRVTLGAGAAPGDVAVTGLRAFDGARVTVAHGAVMTWVAALSGWVPRALARRAAGRWMRRGLGSPD